MEIARWQSRAEAAAVAARETEARCQAAATSSAAAAANALQDARTARDQVNTQVLSYTCFGHGLLGHLADICLKGTFAELKDWHGTLEDLVHMCPK